MKKTQTVEKYLFSLCPGLCTLRQKKGRGAVSKNYCCPGLNNPNVLGKPENSQFGPQKARGVKVEIFIKQDCQDAGGKWERTQLHAIGIKVVQFESSGKRMKGIKW